MRQDREKIYHLLDVIYISFLENYDPIFYCGKKSYKSDFKHVTYRVGTIIPCTQKAFSTIDNLDLKIRGAFEEYLIDKGMDQYFVVDFNGYLDNKYKDWIYLCLGLKKDWWFKANELYTAFKLQGII